MPKNKKIWILTDHRVGNANQARCLASLMGWDGQEHFLEYSLLSSAPNRLPLGLHRLTAEARKKILASPSPDVIISSGRRTAAIAVEIKKISPRVKIVQIMHPELSLEHFDAIILPEHDKKPSLAGQKNVIWTAGAISCVKQAMLNAQAKKLRSHYEIKPETEICSMIIGGATRGRSITLHNIDEMMMIALRYAQAHKGLLIISTSRRTTPEVVKHLMAYVEKTSNVRIILYTYKHQSEYNPYWGMIASASKVIVTADSISMCSEIANCGKQLFVYGRKNMLTPKHQRFMQSLLNSGLAKDLVFGMRNYKPNAMDQSEKLTDAVAKLLGL